MTDHENDEAHLGDDVNRFGDDLKRLGGGLGERARRLEALTPGEREWIAASAGDWDQD